MDNLAPGQERANVLRDGGFTDDEIAQWKGETAQTLQQGGFSPQEVKDYFGQKDPDVAPAKAEIKKNLAALKSEPTEGGEKKPQQVEKGPPKLPEAKDVWEAVRAGWNMGVGPLFFEGKMPANQVAPKPDSPLQNLAYSVGQMAGDAPAMAAGFVGGGAMGTAVPGIGNAAGATMGAFAAPAAMRKMLIDQYQKGNIDDPTEFAKRMVSASWEAAKGAAVGFATEATGGSLKVVNSFGTGAVAKALTATPMRIGAEAIAQTTVAKALEGEMPTKNDFINGAVAIGGLHAVGYGVNKTGYVANKLMNIWGETGAHPGEILEAANSDPALKGELLSADPDLPKEASGPEPEPPAEPKAETPEPNAARDKLLSMIGEKAEKKQPSLATQVKDNFRENYAKYMDYTSVVGDVLKEIGDQPLNEKNAQVLMRLHAAVQDKVQQFVEVGTRDFKTGEINGESLTNIFDDYKEKTGDTGLDGLKAYGIAARGLELAGRGIEQGVDQEAAKTYLKENPEIKPFFDRLVDYKERTLDYLGDSGRYSKEQIQAMKDLNQQYISFKKILEPDPLTGMTPSSTKALKKIGNSDLMLQDPILSTLKDVDSMVRLAHETHATNTFIENMSQAEDPSQFFRVSENQQGLPGKTQIAGYVDGKRTLYDVPEEVADSIKRMAGNQQAMGLWTKMLRVFATSIRLGTVNNPLFALRHAWRNQLTAPTLSQTGLKPFEVLQYAPEYLTKGESYQNFIYDGGGINAIVPLKDDYLTGKIYELDDKAPFMDKAWNKIKDVAGMSHAMITANDNMLRFAEYQRMLEKGATRTEAAFAAREVLPDFQKSGLQKSALQQMTAFLNVHTQGLARAGQETSTNPIGYVAKNLAYITVPSILLMAAQKDDDAIQDLPDWQKYNYWNVHLSNWRDANSLAEAMSVKNAYPSNVRQMPDGKWQVNDGTIWRIQKPFTNGILFGSAFEATMDSWRKQDPKAFENFVGVVGGSAVVEPIPNAVVPFLEQRMNRNFYTGQPIVRQSMENKLPEMQYDRYTSETAKVLGQMLHYVPLVRDFGPKDAKLESPKVIDNYLHTWSGTMGQYAIQTLDEGLRQAGIAPKQVKPTSTLADIPFVKEFVVRFPNAHPQSISDFEDRYQQANRVSQSIKQLVKEGDIAGAVKLQDTYAVNMAKLSGADKAIQNMNAAIQKVNQAPDIDPVQKRQLIDTMMYQMTSIAKEGNKLMDEFEKNVKTKRAGN